MEELLADPAYEGVILAHLRVENHQETAEGVCTQKRNVRKKKEEFCNGHNQVHAPLPKVFANSSPVPLVTAVFTIPLGE